ncbi:hypothetical protein GQ44DRAFT_613803 [Phaeosphaeriaceae sp. PMI808]|nr:hypothetical protein GQ44DRAFT_613803 [Phaeosphaeriaceae sp. PMI808]
MSDYGDDYSDYGDDWFYVEDEYMAADDLAEHAVASPPPTTYGDDDMLPDWDRFDYFNDLEYASDGYDDATFQPHDSKDVKIGQKRKRVAQGGSSNKKRRLAESERMPADSSVVAHSPIVWRSQNDRKPKQRLLADNAQPYALLKDWRDYLTDTPRWARGSPPAKSPSALSGTAQTPIAAELIGETPLPEDGQDEELEDEDGGFNISQEVLMAALQRQLAAAGGPLSGMDPQQLLQYAMRMATDKDAGEDIAGEMAEAMLEGDEEEDADAEENLLSWVAQQRKANNDASSAESNSPDVAPSGTRSTSLKRKVDDDTLESSASTANKRATRSFDAPTATSQAKTVSTRSTRTTRSKR